MPTVGRIDGLRIVIWPNDHRPAHVHVLGPDCEAVLILNCPGGPPELRESFGIRLENLNRVAESLAKQLAECCRRWREIHGNY